MSETVPAYSTEPPAAGPPGEPSTAAAAIEQLSFEQALGELETIVQELERGELDLDAAIRAYERGTALRRHCSLRLKQAELRVERLSRDPDGQVKVEPFAP